VQFYEGSSIVATGQLNAGSVSAVYLNPSVGTHTLQAVYGGDNNFEPSDSATVSLVVQAMPDFTLNSPAPSQTVQGGSIAIYSITVASQPGPFSGAVVLSATGLPAGATASFSPAQVVPGSGTATVLMTITTPVTVVHDTPRWPGRLIWTALILLVISSKARRGGLRLLLGCCLGAVLLSALGCGSRTVASPASTPLSYAITVSGTSTNLAGAVVTHTTVVQLTVR
jgi:hypothetical protein